MFRPHVYSTAFRIGQHPILVSNSNSIAVGKPCPAPPADSPEEVSAWAAPFGFSRPTVLGLAFYDNVLERSVGAFCFLSGARYGQPMRMSCCTANGNQGFYFAWEGITRRSG